MGVSENWRTSKDKVVAAGIQNRIMTRVFEVVCEELTRGQVNVAVESGPDYEQITLPNGEKWRITVKRIDK